MQAILGRRHLAPHPPAYRRQTAAAIQALNPDRLIPMHCSGEPGIAITRQVPGDMVLRSSTDALELQRGLSRRRLDQPLPAACRCRTTPRMPRRIASGGGGQPCTTASTGITLATRPQLA
jgi:hypothetical protein